MITRYEVFLDGIALSSLSPDIVITDVNYSAPIVKDETYTLAKRNGARIFRRSFDNLAVSVSFMIRAYDIRRRQSVCGTICSWAKNGGKLQINDRDGQYLQCVCSAVPFVASVRNWTDEFTMTFTAYSVPFWQELVPSTVELTGTSESGYLWVPGCVDDAPIEVTVTANAALTSVALTVNGRTLTLSGLSVASGGKINIAYDADWIQSIKTGTTSLLNKRTGVDDLLANCGQSNSVSFTANASATVKFSARGLWL